MSIVESIMTTDGNDEPLIVVLDDDDFENDYASFDISYIKSISQEQLPQTSQDQQLNIEVKNLIESLPNESQKVNTVLQTTSNDMNLKKPISTQRSRYKRKHVITDESLDSISSFISFENVSNILTVSRMGSIYYCIEDLHMKIYTSLCTLDEFVNFLEKPDGVLLKKVTLSEKIALEQQNPELKNLNHIRYRLIPINFTDCLIKLKHLLSKGKTFDKVFTEIKNYKQTPSSTISNDKVSPSISSDDNEDQKSLIIDTDNNTSNEPTESIIFIKCDESVSCDILPPNKNILKPDYNIRSYSPLLKLDNNECQSELTICYIDSIEPVQSNKSPIPEQSFLIPARRVLLGRSKSVLKKSKKNQTISRPLSLPSIKFQINDCIKLTPTSMLIHSNNDSCSMPMIVDVEENVEINTQNPRNFTEPLSYPSHLSIPLNMTNILSPSSLSSIPYQKRRDPRRQSKKARNAYDKIRPISNNDSLSSGSIISLLQETGFLSTTASTQEPVPEPCHLPCCTKSKSKAISPNERMIDRQSLPSNPPRKVETLKSPSSTQRNQSRIQSHPYPSPKTFLPPASTHHPQLQTPNVNSYQSNISRSIRPRNTPNELTLPNVCTRSIDLRDAMTLHGQHNMDQIEKLVVRHTKTYANKTVNMMGQLFPIWFNQPDYRCIHCFSCDRVFTPQHFMLHVDDEQLTNEELLAMTSIQLLTSEKMSETKVGLWNQFCTNLTIYARDGRIAGFGSCSRRKRNI